jgi:hypothetical protein
MGEKERITVDPWLEKFSQSLDQITGVDMRKEIMKGSEILSPIPRCPFFASFPIDYENRIRTIDWTKEAMEKLDASVDEDRRIEVMTRCACQFPKSLLKNIREVYEENRDVEEVHHLLKNQFLDGLKRTLKDETLFRKIRGWGWGVAGVKEEERIIATKIPFEREKYFKTTDPTKKRYHYCHCARIREIHKMEGKNVSTTFCYCGGGFYKGIWEEILQKQVKVKILKSLLKGDDVCSFEIIL